MKEFIPEIIKLEINKLTKVSATDNTLLDKNPIRHCMSIVQPKDDTTNGFTNQSWSKKLQESITKKN